MLKTLLIKNYALIEEVEVEFESGLNIITGETGAGKSILIDALSLVLGDRASSDVIRKGAEKAVVEALFGVSGNRRVKSFVQSQDIEVNEDLILRREISAKGHNRCFVNDSPVTLSVMQSLGDQLVDLHGQHDHQSLLRAETHIDLLDDFGGLAGLKEEYEACYHQLTQLFGELEDLQSKERQLRERKDLYEFQIQEIDALNPQPGEEDALEAELRILENAEKLFESTSNLHQLLYEGEQAVYDQLVLARNQLEDLSRIDRAFEEIRNECASAVAIISEVAKFIQSYNSKIEFNPDRLEQIRDRLGKLALLKKKYGGSLDAVIEHRTNIGAEFALAENFEEEIRKLRDRIESERRTCSAAAQRLSSKRREHVGKINGSVTSELAKLGIANARFDVRIENKAMGKANGSANPSRAYVKLGREFFEATPKGIDLVEFYISANLGEELKPLAKVASGGEISRIMLALKTILAKSERLPLLIFDEIDVGVSGRIALAVGRSLKSLSQFHQLVAITHLPQIAGLADTHFVVEKSERDKRTRTRLRKLELEERVEEVAKLMSGTEVTDAGLQGARELMGLTRI
ncbi:MAG: DNA repair protein RecN [Ignavibacteriales bacterium]|nr:DNA repair protein RecN [Ignavibacteriales bacterium]